MKRRLYLCLTALLLLIFLVACQETKPTPLPANGTLTIHYLDVGQADAALLICDGQTMLIDGGNVADSQLVAAYLKEQSISHLNYVVNTHAHEDHVGGLSGALNVATVDKVYAPVTDYPSKAFQNFSKFVKEQKLEITVPQPGDQFSLGEAKIEVLAPQTTYNDENNTSIVLRVDHGAQSFLFTGDAERLSEADMLSAGVDLSASVLKVGHHGSESSSSYPFLREVMPSYAVISVGADNSYGHPNEDPLSRLRDVGATVYRTDLQGHIVLTSDGETLHFDTQKDANSPTNPTTPVLAPSHYIGNSSSKKLHHPDCKSLPNPNNQVIFDSLDAATAEGYTTHVNCISN